MVSSDQLSNAILMIKQSYKVPSHQAHKSMMAVSPSNKYMSAKTESNTAQTNSTDKSSVGGSAKSKKRGGKKSIDIPKLNLTKLTK